jgi:hypothetical protein
MPRIDLAQSLRKVMIEGLVDTVQDDMSWKQKLKIMVRLEQIRSAEPGEERG